MFSRDRMTRSALPSPVEADSQGIALVSGSPAGYLARFTYFNLDIRPPLPFCSK
jgi:hypothetical protein